VSYIMGTTGTPYHQKGKMQNLLDFLSPNWKAFNVELVCTTWIFIELENCWYSQVNQHRCGSKRHIMSQCVYFAFRIIIPFRIISKCSNEMFWTFLYIVFTVAPICHMFFYNQIWRNINF
jgi:hypothetical protein